MKTLLWLLSFMCSWIMPGWSQTSLSEPQLFKASNHAMQYYISLPVGWSSEKTWPVVMILEAAEKQYKLNTERFIRARGSKPFIIVAPIHVNNGNQGRRDPSLFPYTKDTWDYIEKVGDCTFNDDGIKNIITDVALKYKGTQQVYATGFEAGAHTLWTLALTHPEWLKAAAPVACNFRNRCNESTQVSSHDARINLPIRGFVGEKDDYFGQDGIIFVQWQQAKEIAENAGFKNVSLEVIKNKDHTPMPDEVVAYFTSLMK